MNTKKYITPKLITPKLSQKIENLDTFPSELIGERLEIQLLHSDMSTYKKCLDEYMKRVPQVNTYILHVPFLYVSLVTIYSQPVFRQNFVEFIIDMIKASEKNNKEIYILFHMETELYQYKASGVFNWLLFLLRLVENTNVSFLVENSMFTLENKNNQGGPFYHLAKEINHPKLRICFDLCHNYANKNIYKEYYDIAEDIGQYTKSIHFSYTANNDGFRDKKTHGRGHPSKNECIKDLIYLTQKGFNLENTFLVTEICEDDYIYRPDLIKELKILEEIKKE